MIKSQMNPGTMDFYSDAHNMQIGGMRNSNYLREDFPRDVHMNANQGFINHVNEMENHQRNMTHRPDILRTHTQMGKQKGNWKKLAGKNSSVSMHNLNNFGYLKESGSIQVQKTRERPSIFR